ncbi:hypothetical protein DFP74_1274 [Nocardiopsis sp. Huas11]|uniref:hypothetical protein n=1 Tax=Nocardiopsis sp. Huas11 TaxID=2183912 RepID=UPI000EB19753|nr:hypothetical protein [Nocardiopsis sp. Huas11]RKS05669.1 hypothetical protein DFP74_1274 [Nocardiopsis sp. Huas11]
MSTEIILHMRSGRRHVFHPDDLNGPHDRGGEQALERVKRSLHEEFGLLDFRDTEGHHWIVRSAMVEGVLVNHG